MEKLAVLLSECNNIDIKFNYPRHTSISIEGQTRESIIALLSKNSPSKEELTETDTQAVQKLRAKIASLLTWEKAHRGSMSDLYRLGYILDNLRELSGV